MTIHSIALRTTGSLGPAASFGLHELAQALHARGYEIADSAAAQVILSLHADPACPYGREARAPEAPESYTVARPAAQTLALVGSDEVGLMYACLDVAEQLEMGADLDVVEEAQHAPELQVRGLYTFLHNAEAERDWLHSPTYWQDYADELARCRFNRFNLIYGHQSPHLIPIYAFLLDELDSAFPEIRVQDITPEERARNLQALQTASAAMASREIRFFLGIWNSRPWKMAHGVWEDQPTRVTGTDDLGRLAAYTRQGFTRLIDRCPAIKGIQLRMNIESGIGDQRFFVQSFVPALKDLSARGRRLTVELRNWGLHPDTVDAFRSAGVDIVVSTKYFAEHQAMPYQPPIMRGGYSYDSFLHRDKPFPFQWHVWNLGSHRLFNWGDPDYVRRFARSCHLGNGVGYEVTPPGSQKGFSQWGEVTPGNWKARRDLPAQWDFQRYWFFHLAFGRITFDPNARDDVFLWQLARRCTPAAAPLLFAAYRAASQVVSYLISQRMDDQNMYVWPELDCGGPIDHHLVAPPGEVTLFATAREHAENRLALRGSAKRSPLDCAVDLGALADAIEARLAELDGLPDVADHLELRTVRVDFAVLAALARYHAGKSRASGHLALFYASGERRYLDAAEADARQGVGLWDALCARTESYADSLHLGPSGGHWRDNRPRVLYDLHRIQRVRQLFEAYGLFEHGFDLGAARAERGTPETLSGMEPEPRFSGVDATTDYRVDQGYGWVQPAGLRVVGPAMLSREALWGVHTIRPGVVYDPAIVEALPRDGLGERYVVGQRPYTFRIDLPDGEYEVISIAPHGSAMGAPVQVGSAVAETGGHQAGVARVHARALGGKLELVVGSATRWALAGLIARPRRPLIAHLPAAALRAEESARITATATSPDGIRAMSLHYRAGPDERQVPMMGDGVAFQAILPPSALVGGMLEYDLVAESDNGQVARQSYRVPIVASFRAPRVARADGPHKWSRTEELSFRVTLEHGEFAQQLVLHYREADQNREFRKVVQPGGRSGEYAFHVDPRYLDDAYELIYYFEIIDVLGSGSFHPDPWSSGRYSICPPG